MKRLQESGLNQALSEAGDGALAVGPDRRVLFWNRAAERLLGYAPVEAVGRHACEVLEGRQLGCRAACRPECQVLAAAEEGTRSLDLPAWTTWSAAACPNVSKQPLTPSNWVGPP